jgi:hypothetical protein
MRQVKGLLVSCLGPAQLLGSYHWRGTSRVPGLRLIVQFGTRQVVFSLQMSGEGAVPPIDFMF